MTALKYKNANKRDANEAELVAIWEAAGCHWHQMREGCGWDGILMTPDGRDLFIEIKNPLYGRRLTYCEMTVKATVDKYFGDGKYLIISTKEEAEALLMTS